MQVKYILKPNLVNWPWNYWKKKKIIITWGWKKLINDRKVITRVKRQGGKKIKGKRVVKGLGKVKKNIYHISTMKKDFDARRKINRDDEAVK